MRILVVEDDPKLGALLEQGLSEEEMQVERVADGVEALSAALAESYDLILLDYMIPRKSGVEVAIELRRAGRTTPILMLTARDAPEDLRRARDAGVNEIMGKPFRFGELLDRIQALALQGASEE
jgi:two-component system copper resistance phosphate regulon response regulator CusR